MLQRRNAFWRALELAMATLIVHGLFVVAQPPLAASDQVIAFPRDVQEHSKTVVAFVSKNCLACHNSEKREGDVILDRYADETSIRKDRTVWERALIMVQTGTMPPPKEKSQPIEADRKAFLHAADSVLNWVDPNNPDPGRVTMRRLNRNEYDNTVRKLLKVNFSPSAEFPPDDVGGGFDNNGEVLTISPLLMERYLAASEAIMIDAFPPGGSWPTPSKSGRLTGGSTYRSRSPGKTGIQHAFPGQRLTYTPRANYFTAEADYLFRAFCYQIEDSFDVPHIHLEVDGQVVKEFDVPVVGYEGSVFYSVRLKLAPGAHTFSVYWPAKEGDQEKAAAIEVDMGGKIEPPGLHVRWVEVAGPREQTENEKTVLAHQANAEPRDAAREVLQRFASQAFRRPAKESEVERYLKLYDVASTEGLEWDQAIRPALQAILVSPKFIYRVELDDRPDSPKAHPIDEYQLASRLSYFLWNSSPDAELTELAAQGKLTENLEAQVRRMLKVDNYSLSVNFASQWLHLRMLNKVAPDREKFPEFTDGLRYAMLVESQYFFDEFRTKDRSLVELIDSDFTYLNETLAKHYGIEDTKGNRVGQTDKVPGGKAIKGDDEPVRVELQGKDRGGVLTHASVLTVTSNPGRTSPVKRGKWILEQILNAPPPPPPPEVPTLEDKGLTTGTLRQRMEKHRENPSCAACHVKMDAIGFAFENFDPVGKYRAQDGESEIDASGTMPDGHSFNGSGELKQMLREQSDVFVAALTEKLLTYGLGRTMQYYDKPAISKIVRVAAADGYKFSTLIVEIVKSDPFRMRRGKDQNYD